jgi:hypothetical protein
MTAPRTSSGSSPAYQRLVAFRAVLALLALVLGGCAREDVGQAERDRLPAPLTASVVSCHPGAGQIEVLVRLQGRGVLGGTLDASPDLTAMSVQAFDAGGKVQPGSVGFSSDARGSLLRLWLTTKGPLAALRISGLSVALRTQATVRAPSLSELPGTAFSLGPVRARVVDVRRFDEGVGIGLLVDPLYPAPDLQVLGVQDLRLLVDGATFGEGELLVDVASERGRLQATMLRPQGSAEGAATADVRLSVGGVILRYDRALELPLPPCG